MKGYKIMFNNYSDLSYEELRDFLLNGELNHEDMDEENYAFLLDNEVKFGDCNETVLDFCTDGLKRFEKYKECLNFEQNKNIDFEAIVSQHQIEALIECVERDEYEIKIRRKPKRFLVAIAAVVASFAIITVTVSAMGYDIIDLIRNALNSPDKSANDNQGHGVNLTDDFRFYNSMNEMLEIENIGILYPAELPVGYEFTDFEVTDFSSQFILGAYGSEPYISFEVNINVNRQIENYEFEVNGIQYNIAERDGMYHAEWLVGEDYYTIVVGDRAVISEIIENLTEFEGE